MFRFFESIKIIDGIPQNLDFHQDRLTHALVSNEILNSHPVLAQVLIIPAKYSTGLVKCKFIYDDVAFLQEYSFYEKKDIVSLKLVVDNDIDYSFKFLNREYLKKLLEQKNDCDEILIVKNGLITDTSFSNIAFFDGKNWLTPKHPLLKGTCRAKLIENNILKIKDITIKDLSNFKYYNLINAMRGEKLTDSLPIKTIFI